MQLSLISILTDFLRIMFAIVIGFIACVLRTLCIDSVLIVGECDTDDAASISIAPILKAQQAYISNLFMIQKDAF